MQTTSKLVIAGWFAYVGVIWSLKGAVLIYYHRIMYVCRYLASCPDVFSLLTASGAVSRNKRSFESRLYIVVLALLLLTWQLLFTVGPFINCGRFIPILEVSVATPVHALLPQLNTDT
jgi:hypothetical protein